LSIPSIITDVFYILTHLILLLQIFFEILNFFWQQSVHLQLFFHYLLQSLNIRIDIIFHKPNSLNCWNQLTLLSQQLSILLYCCHMSRKHFFLLLQYTCYFFLEGKKFFFILSSHSSLHGIHILFHFLLLLLFHDHIFNLYFFFYFLSLLYCWWLILWIYTYGFFYWVCSVFIFFFIIWLNWLSIFCVLFWYLFWRISWLWRVFFLICLINFRRNFILGIFWL